MQVFHQTENERELLKVLVLSCSLYMPLYRKLNFEDILLNIFMSEIDHKLNVNVELFEIIGHPG